MAVDLELAPKQKRPVGEPCCEPVVYPDIEREQAERMAVAFTDPMKLYLTDDFREAVAAHVENREPSGFKGC
jgi:ArsR family transcriptional regulator